MKVSYPNLPIETFDEAIKLQNEINEIYKKRTRSDDDVFFIWVDKQDLKREILEDGTIIGFGVWECYMSLRPYPFKSLSLKDIMKSMETYDFMKTRTF
jgi:hypothetical protein